MGVAVRSLPIPGDYLINELVSAVIYLLLNKAL